MGLISYFKRNYQNAGANLSVTANIVADHRVREDREQDLFLTRTGVELRNDANGARRAIMGRLSSSSAVVRQHYSVPRDYWVLAHMSIREGTRGLAGTELRQSMTSLAPYVALLVDVAFNSFKDGEAVFVDIGPIGAAIRVVDTTTFSSREHVFTD